MKIRQVKKTDAVKVAQFIQGIIKKEFESTEQKIYPLDDVLELPESYGRKNEAFFIMTDDLQKIIATCGVKEEEDGVGILRCVFVHSKHRRFGYGQQMLVQAIRFCKSHHYRVLTVRTTSAMNSAIALLLKAGFQDRADIDLGNTRILKLTYDCQSHSKV